MYLIVVVLAKSNFQEPNSQDIMSKKNLELALKLAVKITLQFYACQKIALLYVRLFTQAIVMPFYLKIALS